MQSYLQIVISLLPSVILATAFLFAIYQFRLKRGRYNALNISISSYVLQYEGDVQLVSLVVHLENKGDTRIDARCSNRTDGFLYKDDKDKCLHAGTIKIREVPVKKGPFLFDWYSLTPLESISHSPSHGDHVSVADFEQINYLSEYQDPKTEYEEVDFWLEPKESYDLCVSVWLRPGTYATKVFFLGPLTKYQDEDYWTHTTLFRVNHKDTANM